MGSTLKKLKDANKKAIAESLTPEGLLGLLGSKRFTIEQIAEKTGATQAAVKKAIAKAQKHGALIYQFGDEFGVEKKPATVATPGEPLHAYRSRPDGTYLFGFCGDQHLCSKYSRLDVLNDLYDHFAEAGVDRVFNAGNWIDGEARFNKHDLLVHGMDAQVEYLAEHYPQRPGIVTYSVAGDDHEGWYAQTMGVDIGRYAERIMRERGRTDWKNLGYMEAFTSLVHAKHKSASTLLLAHPGGGSAYAVSYTSQKAVEAFEGGEKPAVAIYGHYHKLWFGNLRNVWVCQSGTSQDQTPFMRKKRLEAHVGGGIMRLVQDEQGAIVRAQVEFFRYFNRGYYNDRWSHGGDVTLPDRGVR